MILGKVFHFLFYRFGWVGGLLVPFFLSFLNEDPSTLMGNMQSGASGASSSEVRGIQAPLSMGDPNTGMAIYKAPSPVEVFEIPETPHSGASEAAPGPAEPGQPSNLNPRRAEVELELMRVLQKLEPTTLQGAKLLRSLDRLGLEGASDDLLIALKEQILELERRRPITRNKAIGIFEEFLKNWNKHLYL